MIISEDKLKITNKATDMTNRIETDKYGNTSTYDANGKLIHFKHNNGLEEWLEYDTNCIHYKDSNGFEEWYEYDANGNRTHFKNNNGFESWHEFDANGNEVHYKNNNGNEHWYDANGNEIDKPE